MDSGCTGGITSLRGVSVGLSCSSSSGVGVAGGGLVGGELVGGGLAGLAVGGGFVASGVTASVGPAVGAIRVNAGVGIFEGTGVGTWSVGLAVGADVGADVGVLCGGVGECSGTCVGFVVGVAGDTVGGAAEVDDGRGIGEDCGDRVDGCVFPDSRVGSGVLPGVTVGDDGDAVTLGPGEADGDGRTVRPSASVAVGDRGLGLGVGEMSGVLVAMTGDAVGDAVGVRVGV